ncbi:MAG: cytochrome c [Blastocatellia bacterium]|nr:cytochrome c [Blastocatellia bacterium]
MKEKKASRYGDKRAEYIGFFICFLLPFLPGLLPLNDARSGTVSYSKDVAPILYKSCARCHRPDDIAPFSVLRYQDLRPWAKSIREKVINREMPPWGADRRYGEFTNDPSLSQKEIDTIVAWVDQGAKEGNPKDLPPAPDFAEAWEIGKPDVVLTMPEEQTLAAAGADDYLYFRVPTNFTEDKWIEAVELRPGNRRVVHHAAIFIETPDLQEMAKARARRLNQSSDPQSAPSLFETEAGSVLRKEGTVRRIDPQAQVIDDGCSSPKGGAMGNNSAGPRLLSVYAPGRDAGWLYRLHP